MNKIPLILFLFLFVILKELKADEWPKATTKYFYSENKAFMLKVVPTNYLPSKNILQFFSEHPEKKSDYLKLYTEKPGNTSHSPLDTIITPCHAILYKTTSTDTTLIWEKKLENKRSPVYAFVSNDGKTIITIDDWLGTGYGNNVMVIYNKKGDLLKSYQLKEISPFPIVDYISSISSIDWNSSKKFIDNELFEIIFVNIKGISVSRVYNVRKLKFQ